MKLNYHSISVMRTISLGALGEEISNEFTTSGAAVDGPCGVTRRVLQADPLIAAVEAELELQGDPSSFSAGKTSPSESP